MGGVKPNPRSGLVYEGIELCRKEGVDFVLAVGGGSVIDSSKAIAAGTVTDLERLVFTSSNNCDILTTCRLNKGVRL